MILRVTSREPRAARKGLTLLELLITMVLVSFLLGAIWMVYNSGFKAFYSQWTRTGIKGEFGRTFSNFSLELRQATSVVSAQAAALSFTVDTDNNGVDETIQYSWSGIVGESLKRISSSTASVINSINTLAFSFYDANNNLLSFPVTASAVRLIAVNATVTDKNETFQLRSKIKLRNL